MWPKQNLHISSHQKWLHGLYYDNTWVIVMVLPGLPILAAILDTRLMFRIWPNLHSILGELKAKTKPLMFDTFGKKELNMPNYHQKSYTCNISGHNKSRKTCFKTTAQFWQLQDVEVQKVNSQHNRVNSPHCQWIWRRMKGIQKSLNLIILTVRVLKHKGL